MASNSSSPRAAISSAVGEAISAAAKGATMSNTKRLSNSLDKVTSTLDMASHSTAPSKSATATMRGARNGVSTAHATIVPDEADELEIVGSNSYPGLVQEARQLLKEDPAYSDDEFVASALDLLEKNPYRAPTAHVLEVIFTPLLGHVSQYEKVNHLQRYQTFLDVHGTLPEDESQDEDQVPEHKRFVRFFMDFLIQFHELTDERRKHPGKIFTEAANYLDRMTVQELETLDCLFGCEMWSFRAAYPHEWCRVVGVLGTWVAAFRQLKRNRRLMEKEGSTM